MRIILLFFSIVLPFNCFSQTEKAKLWANETPVYNEIINHYQNLTDSFANCRLIEMGKTDIGKPLHLFLINGEKFKSIEEIKRSGKVFLLINNGIHPGEPDGINASILFAREILKKENKKFLEKCVIGIVPVYNVDGCLNRGKYSRANQNGPEEYGFRGNAKNLDLNRDFIKNDSENAKSFVKLFHAFNPHLFIDTHVSNGADYSYTMTLITSQICKLAPELSELAIKIIEPFMFDYMEKNSTKMIPYVNSLEEKPESGIADFSESPRFATGYTALFNVIGFTTETHMLKPFPQRVKATYDFLFGMKKLIEIYSNDIIKSKNLADKNLIFQNDFMMNFTLDTSQFEWINFSGYEGEYKESEVSGLERLYYNKEKPFEKKIKYFRNYLPEITIEKPYCYVIPQAWNEVISRLKNNNIILHEILKDTSIEAEIYFINSYETVPNPYEGHYLHKNIKVTAKKTRMCVYEGDYIVFTGTSNDRFLVETLEPQSMDSYFAWNFFDEILQQKEWFSDYVFEDLAAQLLREDKNLQMKLDEKKKQDLKFAENAFAQLRFIYENSPFKEKTHNLYPIMKVMRNDIPQTVLIKEIIFR